MTVNSRILIIDDNRAIHDDFRKILAPPPKSAVALSAVEDALFGDRTPVSAAVEYEITSAFQGREGFEIVERAEGEGRPFAFAFVDIRMPPGWDGIETIKRLRQVSPELQVVICTAYCDYSPEEIALHLGQDEGLVVMRKPFDPLEVQDLACKLVARCNRRASGGESHPCADAPTV